MKAVKIMIATLAITAWASVACMAQDKVKEVGVACEVVVLNTTWKIPDRASDKRTAVAVALQIRNDTTKPLLFSRFDTIRPKLRTESGKDLPINGGRDATMRASLADYRMLRPGESTTFVLDAHLYWQNNSLVLGGSDGFGGVWHFTGLDAGVYELGIAYAYNRSGDVSVAGDKGALTVSEDKVWKGEVTSAFMKISLEK